MGTGGHNVPLLNVQGRSDTIRKLTDTTDSRTNL